MALASILSIGSKSLDFSSVCTQAMSIPAPGLDWPSVDESWIATTGGSGSNPSPERDQPSASSSPIEEGASKRREILIVEDNAGDVLLIRQAIRASGLDVGVHIARDGEEAERFFDQADNDPSAPIPALVLLDINLPKKEGGDVLQYLRASRRCGNALVLASSTSNSSLDREKMMRLGANGYFHKPSDYAEFMKLGDVMKDLLEHSPTPPK